MQNLHYKFERHFYKLNQTVNDMNQLEIIEEVCNKLLNTTFGEFYTEAVIQRERERTEFSKQPSLTDPYFGINSKGLIVSNVK